MDGTVDGSALRPVTPIGLVASELAAALEELGPDADVPEAVLARLRRAHELAAGLEPYLGRATTPASGALRRLAERTVAEDWGVGPLEAEMLSGHVEGRFLALLVGVTGARRVLEVGLFTGYSALAMAEALPADGTLVACEVDDRAAAFARAALDEAPAGDRVTVVVGPAQATLDDLARAGDRFDLVFLDADKAGYAGYLDQLLDHDLLAPGGLVCADNTLLQGEPYAEGGPTSANGRAIAEFNRAVAEDPRLEQVVLPLRDGLTLIRRVDDR
ncbi:class I SAM-dependent methyltransferase [Iamia majanohamensis]|uniref:Class I SAM-dependent methyltransferase n=1 Tax=Iamia majanohamensis TaxID=467976 RepID=A0AAE9Y7Y0_9ACTN|nr:class I SAM-dependent methyltransferase [Iamia majanohamensis]WCO66093.1 class I SAM-dependent methyltransferase [Iamia majanohamensis]